MIGFCPSELGLPPISEHAGRVARTPDLWCCVEACSAGPATPPGGSRLCPHPNPVLSLKLRCDHWGAEEQDRPIWDAFWSGGISNSLEVIELRCHRTLRDVPREHQVRPSQSAFVSLIVDELTRNGVREPA